MQKRINRLLEILLILFCSAGADTLSSQNKNEVGLTFSNIDPLGLSYNRFICGSKNIDLQLKTGFAFWIDPSIPEFKHSVLVFTLNPDFEISFLKQRRLSLSFISGVVCNYELKIFKHGSTKKLYDLPDTIYVPYKYPQTMYIVPNTGVQISLILKSIRFQCTVGPRTEFTWILAPQPYLTKKFYWSDKISLGLSAGVYYTF